MQCLFFFTFVVFSVLSFFLSPEESACVRPSVWNFFVRGEKYSKRERERERRINGHAKNLVPSSFSYVHSFALTQAWKYARDSSCLFWLVPDSRETTANDLIVIWNAGVNPQTLMHISINFSWNLILFFERSLINSFHTTCFADQL